MTAPFLFPTSAKEKWINVCVCLCGSVANLIKKTETAIKQNKNKKLGPLNKDFHLKIYRVAPYPYLFGMIVSLWEKFELTKSVFAYVPKRAVPSWNEHKSIVDALKTNDAELASSLVRKQKLRTMSALEKYLKDDGQRNSE